jgi:hypothetical protein
MGVVCYNKCTQFCNDTRHISLLAVSNSILHVFWTLSCNKISHYTMCIGLLFDVFNRFKVSRYSLYSKL